MSTTMHERNVQAAEHNHDLAKAEGVGAVVLFFAGLEAPVSTAVGLAAVAGSGILAYSAYKRATKEI